ncbi:MAG: hypothetical protein D6719_12745 [Candidatus Dadabacteria bacterium]|nr:MAG: hypothetical protein D6719_12745 [Candidatus Dadabacteria bacterium]
MTGNLGVSKLYSIQNRLEAYLYYFQKQDETGLLIVEDQRLFDWIDTVLKLNCFKPSLLWHEVLDHLEANIPTYTLINEPLSKELYDIIAQHWSRRGMIQIMDRDSMELRTVHFDPHLSKLLLVVNRDDLEEIENRFSIKNKVGLTVTF